MDVHHKVHINYVNALQVFERGRFAGVEEMRTIRSLDQCHVLLLMLQVFERGHFAGVEEMRTNERLFNRVAPMGVNDVAMACMYKFVGLHKLGIPMTSFDGLDDNTIDPGEELLRWNQLVQLVDLHMLTSPPDLVGL